MNVRTEDKTWDFAGAVVGVGQMNEELFLTACSKTLLSWFDCHFHAHGHARKNNRPPKKKAPEGTSGTGRLSDREYR